MAENTTSRGVYRNNQVAQEEIWKESVKRERTAAAKWKKYWGFMTQLDIKGQSVIKRELPQNMTYYKGENIPLTTNQYYGSKLSSTSSVSMAAIERMTSHHKRKSDIRNNYC